MFNREPFQRREKTSPGQSLLRYMGRVSLPVPLPVTPILHFCARNPERPTPDPYIHLPAGLPEMLVGKLVVVGDHFDESEKVCEFERIRVRMALRRSRSTVEREYRPLFAFS